MSIIILVLTQKTLFCPAVKATKSHKTFLGNSLSNINYFYLSFGNQYQMFMLSKYGVERTVIL